MKKLIFLCILIFLSFLLSVNIVNFKNSEKNVSDDFSLKNKPVIIVDAGHGGFDGGASTDDGVSEKGINLNIALYLKDYLNFFGYNVVMTRENDNSNYAFQRVGRGSRLGNYIVGW